MIMEEKIPVIDVQEIKGEGLIEKVREACKKWGCFRVTNHAVPSELMAEMKSVARDMFDGPMETKQRHKEVVPGSGYKSPRETFETYGIFESASSTSDAVSNFCSLHEASPRQRDIMTAYAMETSKLAMEVASMIATSMGLTDYSFEGWSAHFRMNKYSFTQETIGSTAAHNHTDSGFLTILQEDENVGGLEVMNPCGAFVAVDPMSTTFLVILGDVAVPWSNGQLRNLQHRVLCKDAGIRLSIVTSLAPEGNKTIEAHPKLLEPDHAPCFAPFTYADYRKVRFSEKLHAGEALDWFRWRADNTKTCMLH